MSHREMNTHPPLTAPVQRGPARSTDQLLDEVRAFDSIALWSTRRIRTCLHSKQPATTPRR